MLLFLLFFLFLSPHPFTLSLNQDGLFLLHSKRQLSDPDNVLSNWNSADATPCHWYGVTCHPISGEVTAVNVTGSNLSGPLPISLCRIPSLSSLSLSFNYLNSTIPPAISSCNRLQYLDLSENELVGPIPETLSLIPNLRLLNLSFNNLSGDVPSSFGQFQRLEILNLVYNFLNGTIPSSLGNISTLRKLQLADNDFKQGPIPSEFGNLTNLEVLWLSGCKRVGSIPPSLGRLARLSNMDLSENKLTGTIPESFVGLKNIYQLELYENSLSGELPTGMSNMTSLRNFDVSANHLSGRIPDELCQLPLESLNLFFNQFEGTLPESIALSPNLNELKIFSNKLTGKLPRALGNNSRLLRIDVSDNQFYGEIPENLCRGGVLQQLILIDNSFSGNIPESLGNCESLTRIRLTNNNLSGMLPNAFWGLPGMMLLELNGNSLSGQIPNTISGAHNLSELLIWSNQFSGSLPEGIGSLVNLVKFNASHNNLTGRIPASMIKLNQLNELDLSDNKLTGEIPGGIHYWKRLNALNLANNRLDGNIPNEIGSMPVLNYLDLSGNNFSGEIPLGLQNLKLNKLNLSNNQLSGDIPPLYANENYRLSFLGNPRLCGMISGRCSSSGKRKRRKYVWIFLSIFIFAGIMFIFGVAWFYLKYRNLKKLKKGVNIIKWRSFHKLGFSEFEIEKLLSEENVIGSGASGKVYKVVLSNGEVVAVKKLWGEIKKDNGNACSDKDVFEVEVETLGKIRHKSIVRLWCCCNSGCSKLLVYEYMPNGSLADLLKSSKKTLLDWPTRHKIAIDAAEGLSYLHHDCVPPIVHRDVKSSNILLDAEFGAKVADFGVAKFVRAVSQGAVSMSVIAGSYGYIAPEYAYTLRVNEKSDIYSFGVVILELVTGKPPIDPEYGDNDLVKWVSSTLEQTGLSHVIDPTLDSRDTEEMSKVLNVGLLCTNSLPINRPSMRRVVKLLQEARVAPQARSNTDGKCSPYYHDEEGSDHQKSTV